MKVLITGAAGQLGSDVIKVLESGCYQVIPTDLSEFNVTDLGTTVNFVNSVRPDTIVHSAAFTDVDACESQREKAFAVNAERGMSLLQQESM